MTLCGFQPEGPARSFRIGTKSYTRYSWKGFIYIIAVLGKDCKIQLWDQTSNPASLFTALIVLS